MEYQLKFLQLSSFLSFLETFSGNSKIFLEPTVPLPDTFSGFLRKKFRGCSALTLGIFCEVLMLNFWANLCWAKTSFNQNLSSLGALYVC